MSPIILTLCLLVQPSVLLPVAGDLPGSAFARPKGAIVLRGAPSAESVGVLMAGDADVLRVGEPRGTQREVFVPQGFPVYLHRDFCSIGVADAGVTVTGDRVNVRLLPATEGLLPIAQIARGTGPLVLLDREGEWVRVLAPVDLPLYAAQDALAETDDASARAAWEAAFAARDTRRAEGLARLRAADPEWRRQSDLLAAAESLADVDVSRLDAGSLAARREEVARLRSAATWDETRETLDKLDGDLALAGNLRAQAQKSADEVKARTQADSAELARESHMLSLGLRYTGRGEAVTRAGTVHREGADDAPVYSLHTTEGEILKLSAPADVATLPALVGKRVELAGRRLFLATVSGPVLVVDQVVAWKAN